MVLFLANEDLGELFLKYPVSKKVINIK